MTATQPTGARPENVGILAMDVYFPKTCVDQAELEKHDGASTGKYTIGLGQTKMAFVDDREDIHSICLTVVSSLMEKYGVSYSDIGRMEVGTETIVDKSKSVKTVLMQLFAESGNYEVEGIDTTNACYGGTNALFNAINWVESSSWDGRLALVVAGDLAIYSSGSARPTGGAGVAALLVGPNAPIVIEVGARGTHMEHLYDFYKPDLSSEFPVVDGQLSVASYLKSFDMCYQRYMAKLERKLGLARGDASLIDYFVCHSPFTKQVQKAMAHISMYDFKRNPEDQRYASVQQYLDTPIEQSYTDKVMERAFIGVSKDELYKNKAEVAQYAAKNLGNLYCGSVYGGLASLISQVPSAELAGKRITLFSYGSGSAATMFSLIVRGDTDAIAKHVNIVERLAARTEVAPVDYEKVMELREKTHQLRSYTPVGPTDNFFPGTYYLVHVDDMYRRQYARSPLA
ncbi:hydroxymethylglutaryl-coenzyme A synthase N terminal-domain-containing protein [Thamnocephalis sphaerospora]|uniref:Hydroxymethylglutaryl-CoA synthase n=1 Tax=Thamnocephalis sphaerospora TaxID=78915 RepID=A0A4V1IWB7_9FUNG|nr:hydroxymethylglutaryl-coenzyme A synthase N terminal-domain-containing protein [Thamnocephalis sphaerospora]|eukprot:RKP06999.1 hydroxymethylglutaryl-coenzyme A synthase N terminal-domain-containing protein [Thamnocephalis sphaerospora]